MTVKTRHVQLTFTSIKNPAANFIINPIASYLLQRQIYIKFQIEKQVSSEPNKASLEIYGLSEQHAAALAFVFDPFAKTFGASCRIHVGHIEKGVPQAYKGVITSATTSREGANIITRVQLRNNYFELMRKQVTLPVSEGQSKAQAVIAILNQVEASVIPSQVKYLNDNLGDSKYAEDDILKGTLDELLTKFSKGLPRRIVIYWDDAGVNFTPLGKLAEGIAVKKVSSSSGLIGVPKVTETGLNFELELEAVYKIGDPVVVESPVISGLVDSSKDRGATKAAERLGITAVSKVIHTGDNWDGEFKTPIETKFIDQLKQFTK